MTGARGGGGTRVGRCRVCANRTSEPWPLEKLNCAEKVTLRETKLLKRWPLERLFHKNFFDFKKIFTDFRKFSSIFEKFLRFLKKFSYFFDFLPFYDSVMWKTWPLERLFLTFVVLVTLRETLGRWKTRPLRSAHTHHPFLRKLPSRLWPVTFGGPTAINS